MKTQAFIFDIDGTIADCSHRLHFLKPPANLPVNFPSGKVEGFTPDWDAFYDACVEDTPMHNVIELLEMIDASYEVIFVTGRPERIRDKTEQWIMNHSDLYGGCSIVLMRKDGDHRPDYQVKREIYETQIKDKYDVIGVFEDRKQCVDMWRALGLQCYQVNKGDY